MSVERDLLVAILELTRDTRTIDYTVVGKRARLPTQVAEKQLTRLADTSLIRLKGRLLKASTDQRVRIAVKAVELGSDFERVCRLLEWKEFESIVTEAVEFYDYSTYKNVRFKGRNGKRWEIDLVASKQPTILSVDCKRWRSNWTRAPVAKIVEEHVKRTEAFTEILPKMSSKINLEKWEDATVIPLILSLLPSPMKFHRNTPIVPILKLQDFLNELPAYIGMLTHFSKNVKLRDKKITEL